MNSVVSPLRMQPASTMHQPQYHPHAASAATTVTSAKPRHVRHASNPQLLYAAPRPHPHNPQMQPQYQQQQQQKQQQQLQRPQPQLNAAHQDVLLRAQEIARAQAQIQAQMQAYATQQQQQQQQQVQQLQHNIFYGQAFASASLARSGKGNGGTGGNGNAMNMRPTAASSATSSSSSSSTSGRHAQPQPQQTLHQLHQRSTGATVTQATPAATRSTATAASAQPAANSSAGAIASASRIEWRVAIDPKTKRPYYYHPITRETTWKKPQELVEREKREKKQFFFAMENNIRTKLRAGNWLQKEGEDDASQQPYRHSDIGVSSNFSSSHAAGPVRNSLSSMDRKQKPRALGLYGSRSAPNTPEFAALSLKPTDSSNQDSTDDDDDEEEDELTAAASKPPLLFRTLSSYETPVVMEKKHGGSGGMAGGIVGSRLVTIPSPIQERVRLASAMQPRASDLESYAQSVERHGPVTSADVRQPLRRRSNSTSTIYVRMGTMNSPDQDCTIKCVATVLRAHMVEAVEALIKIDSRFDVFINRRERERLATEAAFSGVSDSNNNATPSIPSLKEIAAFIKHVFSRAQMESECIIMSLIYVERLLKATSGSLQLLSINWRSILFCSMVMASKVWDDLSMCNADFSKILPELSLKEINDLELTYLSAVEYNVRVSAVSYAKYYFHLRSMCATMGMLAAFDESAPLNLDGARKMQVLSEEYQERSKLMPAPRRRSVTITATTVESRIAAANKPNKPSPAASLEQLVHMQVRGAGGSSLASMHRLSGKN